VRRANGFAFTVDSIHFGDEFAELATAKVLAFVAEAEAEAG